MNRQQKRKEAKKNKKIGDSFIPEKTTKSEIERLMKISFVVILIFILLYFGIGIFISKDIVLPRGNKNTEEEITIDPSNILANSIFKQKEEEYYVYFYDFNNETTDIASIVNSITDLKIYKVDTSDVLNRNYVVEDESNKNAKTLDDLKVKKDTIIKITNDEITGYYEGLEEIENNLG